MWNMLFASLVINFEAAHSVGQIDLQGILIKYNFNNKKVKHLRNMQNNYVDKDNTSRAAAVQSKVLEYDILNVIGNINDRSEKGLAMIKNNSTFNEKEWWNCGGNSITVAMVLKEDIMDIGNMEYIRDYLNSTINVLNNSNWPILLSNGTVVGGHHQQVLVGDADISISPATFTENYFRDVHILQPTYTLKVFVYFQQPDAHSIRNVYIDIYPTLIWFLWIVLWVVLFLSLTAGQVVVQRRLTSPKSFQMDHNHFLNILSIICQQGGVQISTNASLCWIQFLSFLVSVVNFTIYSAYLVALLNSKVFPVKDFSDIEKFQFDLYTYENNLQGTDHLKTTNYTDAIKKLHSSRNGFVHPNDWFEKNAIVNNLNATIFYCKAISKIPVHNIPTHLGIFIRKSSPLKEILSITMIKMKNNGISRRIFLLKPPVIVCPLADLKLRNFGFQSLEIIDVYLSLLVLMMGIVASIIFLTIENKWLQASKSLK